MTFLTVDLTVLEVDVDTLDPSLLIWSMLPRRAHEAVAGAF